MLNCTIKTLVSDNKNHPSIEHSFPWNALQILKIKFIPFKKKKREKGNGNITLHIIKTAQPWSYMPMT